MTSSLNSDRESLSSAKAGFLLSDALIAVMIIAMMALMINNALHMHASMQTAAEAQISRMEEEALWHLKECQSCVPAIKEDSSLQGY